MKKNKMLEREIERDEEMDERDDEVAVFTFADLFGFLKRSLTRIVVFCCIAALFMGIVVVTFITVRKPSNESIETLITYNYSGVELGKDPLGYDLNVNKIKSPSVVSKAIDIINANGERISSNKVADIITNMEIDAIIPKSVSDQLAALNTAAAKDPTLLGTLADFKYFPHQYKIRLTKFKELDISRVLAQELVDGIIEEYIRVFRLEYGQVPLLSSDAIINNAETAESLITSRQYDYIELFDVYAFQIQQAQDYLRAKMSQAPMFRSERVGKTFNDLIMELTVISNTSLDKYESFVIQNCLTNDAEFTIKYLDSRYLQLDTQLNQAKANAKSIFDTFDDYEMGDIIWSVDKDTGEIVYSKGGPTETYDQLVLMYVEAEREVNRIQAEMDRIDLRRDQFENGDFTGNTTENQTSAIQRASLISSQIYSIIVDANTIVQEYMDTEYFNSAVSVNLKGQYVVAMDSALSILLIVSGVIIVLTACSAMIVTYLKEKRETVPDVA